MHLRFRQSSPNALSSTRWSHSNYLVFLNVSCMVSDGLCTSPGLCRSSAHSTPSISTNFVSNLEYNVHCESRVMTILQQVHQIGKSITTSMKSRSSPTKTHRRSSLSVPAWWTGPPRLRVQLQHLHPGGRIRPRTMSPHTEMAE